MALSDVRRHHMSMVVELLLERGPRSRAHLAEATGLTKGTLTSLVGELLDRGVLVELDARRDGQMGRPGVDVEVRSSHYGAMSLEISVDGLAACVVDLSGNVRSSRRIRSENRRARPTTVVARLSALAGEVLDEAERQDVSCVGGALAVPGLVDPTSQALVVAPNLHWRDVVLTQLSSLLGMDLVVENEANLAALAELRHGVARDLRSFVYVSGGIGIGGGLVLDRHVVGGANGFAGELGHVVVDPDGPRCACGGRGCLETVIGSGVDARPADVAHALAIALRSVVHLVDPEAIVLGGSLAHVPELPSELAPRLANDTIGGRWHPCVVRRSVLGADAALIGAATMALDAFVADPITAADHAVARSA